MDFLKDYNLVWFDNFDGNDLDMSKWTLKAEMWAQSDLELRDDKTAVKVEHGNLHLMSDIVTENTYYTNTSVSTLQKMHFKYGYIEIRAKLPFGKPAWPSFWMLADNKYEATTGYRSEIDIFEVFGDENRLESNIHKWYRDGSGRHEAYPYQRKTPKIFSSKEEAEKWHTYGLLWTNEKLEFMVDGEAYQTMDITENGEFSDDNYGMKGYHTPHYIIFNNYVYTKGYKGCETWAKGKEATPNDKFPINYYIDYVKLYQKDNDSQLIEY